MKKLLISVFTISSYLCHAQEAKPTGGCSYHGRIEKISPAPMYDSCLIMGKLYSVDVFLEDLFLTCETTIIVKLDSTTIGKRKEYQANGTYTMPLDLHDFDRGTYMLNVYREANWPDPLLVSKRVRLVRASQLGEPMLSGEDFELYPIPAHDMLHVKLPGQIIEKITMIDAWGRRVQDLACDKSFVTVPVADIPNGIYIVQIQTSETMVNKRVVVAH